MTISTTSIIKQLAVLFLTIAGLYYAKGFLIPICIAGLLATLFVPLCQWLEKRKLPKVLAALACLLLLLSVIGLVISLLGWQLSGLIDDFSRVKQTFIDNLDHVQEYIFRQLNLTTETQSKILLNEQPSLTAVISAVAGSALQLVTDFILVLAYTFLLLYYRGHLRHFIVKITPPQHRIEMEQILSGVSRVSQQYLVGLAKMIVCLWIMYSIGFSLIGVKNAIFFAVLCGILEIVPFVGNLTGTLLTVSVAAVQGAGLPMLVGIVVIYGCIQFIQGWVLEPIILGPQVKINPFSTVLALVLGEMVWGVAGIFLAIPLIAMFKIVCDHVDPLQPYGFLIGTADRKDPT